MFCIYCGTANPDDALFCVKCGKHVGVPPAANDAPQKAVTPPAVVYAPAPPKVEAPPAAPAVLQTTPAEAPRRAREVAGKKRGMRWGWIVSLGIIILFILLYPVRNGGGVCDAARDEVIQQVPPPVEILAARYPVRVGLLRSLFNDQGSVDNLAKDYVRNMMQQNQQNPSASDCYVTYYAVMFTKDRVRAVIADWIEKQLQLK